MATVQPVPRASQPEAAVIASDFKERFGTDAIPAARALYALMLQKEQSERASVYHAVIAELEGSGR